MSYIATNWQTGDTITASKLNNMENGIKSASTEYITISYDSGWSADHTYAQITQAVSEGKHLICRYTDNNYSPPVSFEVPYVSSSSAAHTFATLNSWFSTSININSNNSVDLLVKNIYELPVNGIPESDLANGVKNKLDPIIVPVCVRNNQLTSYTDVYVPKEVAGNIYTQLVTSPERRRVIFSFYLYDTGADNPFLVSYVSNAFDLGLGYGSVGYSTELPYALTRLLSGFFTYINFEGDGVFVLSGSGYELGEDWVVAVVDSNATFTVTLTPTSQDFSGTMNKTPEEIWDAYSSGKKIRFSIPSLNASVEATLYSESDLDSDGVYDSVQAGALITYDNGTGWLLILLLTNDASETYSTTIFGLTTM